MFCAISHLPARLRIGRTKSTRRNPFAREPYQYFNSLLAVQQDSPAMSEFRFWRRKLLDDERLCTIYLCRHGPD